jgi:hypothetical protein
MLRNYINSLLTSVNGTSAKKKIYIYPQFKLDIHVSIHHDLIYKNDQQDATV